MKQAALATTLVCLAACGSRPEAPPKPERPALFQEAAAESGLVFRHDPGLSSEFYLPEIMGAGVALLDYDNDGDLDIFLLQGRPLKPGGPAPASGNRLFRNDLDHAGKLRFTDVTEAAGLHRIMYGMGAATGDYDNDGYVDLYVTAYGSNALYHNNGDGTFRDVTAAAGVDDVRWSTSATFADVDRDGNLDLFVLNYVDFTPANNKKCVSPSGQPDYCTPKAYRAVPARLFRNRGGGRFADIGVASGIAAAYGPGLGVSAVDLNADGWLDLFVANDTAANLLWINRGNGQFVERGVESGVAYSEDGVAKAGMGVSAGDFDGDGDDDLFVVNLAREGATLLSNDGRGSFLDVSLRTGLRAATLAFTGFGTNWFDYDNDGRLDLFVANGGVTVIERQASEPWPFRQRNSLLHNLGGQRFEDVTAQAGPAFAKLEVGRGAAFGDIDNDGDVDILVSNNNGPARLWLNRTAPAGWASFRLEAVRSNRMALGARVCLLRAGLPPICRRAHTDSSYLSAGDPRVHFGLGANTAIEAVIVHWPDGSRERWARPPIAGRLTVLRQGTGSPAK